MHREPIIFNVFLTQITSVGNTIALSAVSLAEIVYLVEKGRLPDSAYHDLKTVLQDTDYVIEEAALTAQVVEAMRQVSRSEVPDMPDRIVAATALSLGVPVITRDGRIRASNLQTVW
jgi:PIN domain nuclease of toxin-antitoxin system